MNPNIDLFVPLSQCLNFHTECCGALAVDFHPLQFNKKEIKEFIVTAWRYLHRTITDDLGFHLTIRCIIRKVNYLAQHRAPFLLHNDDPNAKNKWPRLFQALLNLCQYRMKYYRCMRRIVSPFADQAYHTSIDQFLAMISEFFHSENSRIHDRVMKFAMWESHYSIIVGVFAYPGNILILVGQRGDFGDLESEVVATRAIHVMPQEDVNFYLPHAKSQYKFAIIEDKEPQFKKKYLEARQCLGCKELGRNFCSVGLEPFLRDNYGYEEELITSGDEATNMEFLPSPVHIMGASDEEDSYSGIHEPQGPDYYSVQGNGEGLSPYEHSSWMGDEPGEDEQSFGIIPQFSPVISIMGTRSPTHRSVRSASPETPIHMLSEDEEDRLMGRKKLRTSDEDESSENSEEIDRIAKRMKERFLKMKKKSDGWSPRKQWRKKRFEEDED